MASLADNANSGDKMGVLGIPRSLRTLKGT